MATTQEGTGKHPHKSAAEPHEHHEAPTSKSKDTQHESSTSHSTGSHKETASHSTGSHTTGTHKETASHSESSPTTGKSTSDLESRAYTGPDGKEHHHTTKYAEQHKGDK